MTEATMTSFCSIFLVGKAQDTHQTTPTITPVSWTLHATVVALQVSGAVAETHQTFPTTIALMSWSHIS